MDNALTSLELTRIAYCHIKTLGLHLDLSDTKEHIIPNGFNTPLCMYTGKSDVML